MSRGATAAAVDFARNLPDPAGTDFGSGAHTDTFWRRTAPGQLHFLASTLRDVR